MDFNIRTIREHDLLLLSRDRIDVGHDDNDIKRRAANPEYLQSLLTRRCAMFGFVTNKASGGNGKGMVQLESHLELVVDISKSNWLVMSEQEKSFTKMYVYYYESLATTFREYKTIRMSEFYPMAKTITQPKPKSPSEKFINEESLTEDIKL